MAYEKPVIVDYGTVTEHTFVLSSKKGLGFEDGILEERDGVASP